MRSVVFCAIAFFCAIACAGEVRIVGETKYPAHALVRLRAEGDVDEGAVLWLISPARNVTRATTPRGVLEFAAPPGKYRVELMVFRVGGIELRASVAHVDVEIAQCCPRYTKPDPHNAACRLKCEKAGCSATIVGPRRHDGRWDILSAAHCFASEGQVCTIALADGREFKVRVVALHRLSDIAWCVTEDVIDDLPYAVIAQTNPEPGVAIWHTGYGVDQPRNREEGTVDKSASGQVMVRMTLSVSHGDSGAGIFRSDTNELVSVVSATTRAGQRATVIGPSTEEILRTRPPQPECCCNAR